MSETNSEKYDDDKLNLNHLTEPIFISHAKVGNTLSANDDTFIFQDGSTTIEIRRLPDFERKRIPWRDGLIRDIVWCAELNVFILLTQKSIFTLNPQSIVAPPTTKINTDIQLKINAYGKMKPYNENYSFWRCTCAGTTLYISYSGFGTIVDEYLLGPSSCEFVDRWIPPRTCENYEGIWCIRYHPEIDQLGITIMDRRNNQWRFEIRNRKNFSPVWKATLPITYGDCELLPLPYGEWLTINSCGVRLIHIANRQLKFVAEYERELKNATIIGTDYFIVRTKNTLNIHSIKQKAN